MIHDSRVQQVLYMRSNTIRTHAYASNMYNILFLITVRHTTYVFFIPMEILLMCICVGCMHVVFPHGLDVCFVLSFLIFFVWWAMVEVSLLYLFSFKAMS